MSEFNADPWIPDVAPVAPVAPGWGNQTAAEVRAVTQPDPTVASGGLDPMDVERVAYDLRVREAAREKVAAERLGPIPPFDAGMLSEVLARPAEPVHRAEGIVLADAGTLLVAQRKTGKTTLQLNYARCLLTGEDFLDKFGVRPLTGRVAFLNYEVSAAQLARWADEVGVPADRMFMVNLRGRRNPFAHDDDLQSLAVRLRELEVEALFVDPFGRAFHGKSQNDPGEVGAWLAGLDRFARGEAGVTDVVLSAHAGWNGERTRGASALEDWADSVVTLVRDPDDESTRFLRAEGRDVEVDEDRLGFDPGTRHLSLTGQGSRKQSSATRHLDELLPTVLDAIEAEPGITGYGLDKVLRDDGAAFSKGDCAKAARLGVDRGRVRIEPGKRNSKCFYPLSSPTSLPTPPGDINPPPPPPPIGEVGGGGGQPPSASGEVVSIDNPSSDCPSCIEPLTKAPHPDCDVPDLHEGRLPA